LGQHTKTGKNIPERPKNIQNDQILYQLEIKCTKWRKIFEKSGFRQESPFGACFDMWKKNKTQLFLLIVAAKIP
jgi:hypothetical protein